jgi:hypothetical protein
MAPPKAGVPPTPKKLDEAKVRRVGQIGRLLVGELSEVGPDGAVIDIGQAWKGFIPAPMFAWHPRDEGAGEASTSGREGGGGGNVPRKGSEEEVLRKGFSEEMVRTREELERTLYGVKLKVSAGIRTCGRFSRVLFGFPGEKLAWGLSLLVDGRPKWCACGAAFMDCGRLVARSDGFCS